MILLSAAGLVLMISQIVWASESCAWVLWEKSCRGECKVTSKGAYPPTGYKQCAKDVRRSAMEFEENIKSWDTSEYYAKRSRGMGDEAVVSVMQKTPVGDHLYREVRYACFPHPVKPE